MSAVSAPPVDEATVETPARAVPRTRRALARPELWLAGAAFLASGAAGLVYQVSWQRILALHSGVGIYSVAMIVAAFMAGIGLGAHLGGAWSLRLDAAGALWRFVAVELGIALWGAASCWLYYDLLYARAVWLYAEPWRAGLMHLLSLMPPTLLMGMSLPLLTRSMVAEARTAGSTIGFLYAVNILGAAAGALLTPWVLVPRIGIRGATLAAAAANVFTVAAGLAALALLRRHARRAGEGAAEAGEPAPSGGLADEGASGRSFALWAVLYAASGFCALSLEIVWFRLLDVAVKSKAFTFGTLLSLYLLGCGIGCLAGIALVPRLRRPLRAFLLCQTWLLAYAGAMVALLAYLPADVPPLDRLVQYWSRGSGGRRGDLLWLLYGQLPLLLFGPATVLMGLSFPILQKAVQDDPRTSGRKVGLLQAANIGGCVAGSLLVGLVGLRWLGTTGTLTLLVAGGIGFAVVGMRAYGRRSLFVEMAVLLAVVAALLPGQRRLWLRVHGTEDPTSIVQEDATGLAALVPRQRAWLVFVDGKSHSWLPFGGVHTQLGAVPALVHPRPEDVAIVGLGSGDTAWAAGCRRETRSLTVFEISGGQPRILRRLADRELVLGDLRALLDDPRVTIRVADGRHALMRSDRLFDVIEADALWPDVAYAGNLYSTEFFALCGSKLKPGGLVVTWAPTPRVYASFIGAFRHVVGTPERHVLIGSNEPISLDLATWRRRLNSPEVREYLGEGRLKAVDDLLVRLQPLNRRGRRLPRREMNFDLFPRDEFDIGKLPPL